MKNIILIMLFSLSLTTIAYAAHPYQDGAKIKIDNNLTFTCRNPHEYSFLLTSNDFWNSHKDIFQLKFESVFFYNGQLVDNDQFYKSFEEAFTSAEIDAFAANKEIYIDLDFGLDHSGNVINVDMAIKIDPLTVAIPPERYAKLRSILMKNLKFIIDRPNTEMSCYRTNLELHDFQRFKDRAIKFR